MVQDSRKPTLEKEVHAVPAFLPLCVLCVL
jgi:hypothetical protein